MVDNLQMILNQMEDLKGQITGIQNHFDERMTTHEEMVKDHFGMCKQLCMTKIDHVETATNKAHDRLDRHKTTLECLEKYKNRGVGALIIVGIALSLVGYEIIFVKV